MRVYYQDAQIRVTSSAVSVRGRLYPLCDIERTWRAGRRSAGARVTVAASLLLVVALVQLAIGLLLGWVAAGSGTAFTVVAVLLVRTMVSLMAGATALHAVEEIRRYGRRLELWASVPSAQVLLLSTDDAIQHGRARRALARALDDRDRCEETTRSSIVAGRRTRTGTRH